MLSLAASGIACGDEVACSELRVTSARWRAADDRPKLAERVSECKTLERKSSRAVVAMLGQPDDRNKREWSYFVGGGTVDDRHLYVVFDARDRVKRVELDSP